MSLLAALYRGGWLRAVDHALAESLRRSRPDTADAVLAAAALASRAVANGHSRLPLVQTRELLLEIASDREPPELPQLDAWLTLLRASPWTFIPGSSSFLADADSSPMDESHAGRVLVLENDAIALHRYWAYEIRLLRALRSLTAANPSLALMEDGAMSALDRRIAQFFPDAADSGQALAARAVLDRRFLLLTGGPGTGKTRVVAHALAVFAERFVGRTDGVDLRRKLEQGNELNKRTDASETFPRVLLAAPTGKAAARLSESVRENLLRLADRGLIERGLAQVLSVEAQTLHRLLGWQRDSTRFKHTRDNPLPADLIVIDEASMVDLPLMCKLFEAVAANATLILVGDADQLPAVEAGDVLSALCEATGADKPRPSATASASAPLSVHDDRLARHRVHLTRIHRQDDAVDIAVLANTIRDGHAEAALEGLTEQRFRGVQWRPGDDRGLAQAVLEQALPAYRAVQSAASVEAALVQAKRFQVLTAVREGSAGSRELNALIASALDPLQRGDGLFPGQLILITENSYRHGLSNGDIGIAWRDERDELRVWFDGHAGLCSWLPAALPAYESAFALTVHKAQGSEFDRVFLALPERGARTLSRELLYTGLTRCRRQAMLWASEAALREGIGRRHRRWSGLIERLAEL
jgi:exodeoxyribonuclease V alpha subunit